MFSVIWFLICIRPRKKGDPTVPSIRWHYFEVKILITIIVCSHINNYNNVSVNTLRQWPIVRVRTFQIVWTDIIGRHKYNNIVVVVVWTPQNIVWDPRCLSVVFVRGNKPYSTYNTVIILFLCWQKFLKSWWIPILSCNNN